MELDMGGAETRELLEGDEMLEGSFIDLVLAASESSDDLGEIFDQMDELLDSRRICWKRESGQETA